MFEPGDAWVRTGDLMRTDDQGFYYFVDRIGDTFRWKGENVATAEVAAAVRAFPGVRDACVYGVEVPGASGKAGMAALVVGAGFDLAALRAHLAQRLPDYARPVFLRLVGALDVTETFKLKKQALAAEGWDRDRAALRRGPAAGATWRWTWPRASGSASSALSDAIRHRRAVRRPSTSWGGRAGRPRRAVLGGRLSRP